MDARKDTIQCIAETGKKVQCTRAVVEGTEYCKQHLSKQQDVEDRCLAEKKDGTQCSRRATQGEFCTQHSTTNDKPKSKESGGGSCTATTKAGTQCTRASKYDGMCAQHAGVTSPKKGSTPTKGTPTKTAAKGPVCGAVTAKGEPCTKTAKEGGFCGIHSKKQVGSKGKKLAPITVTNQQPVVDVIEGKVDRKLEFEDVMSLPRGCKEFLLPSMGEDGPEEGIKEAIEEEITNRNGQFLAVSINGVSYPFINMDADDGTIKGVFIEDQEDGKIFSVGGDMDESEYSDTMKTFIEWYNKQ